MIRIQKTSVQFSHTFLFPTFSFLNSCDGIHAEPVDPPAADQKPIHMLPPPPIFVTLLPPTQILRCFHQIISYINAYGIEALGM